jgi:hypothetical protein
MDAYTPIYMPKVTMKSDSQQAGSTKKNNSMKNVLKLNWAMSAVLESRTSKSWGIVSHSTEKCGGFEKNVGDLHLPYNMTYRKEFIYFTFRHLNSYRQLKNGN